MSLCKRKGNTYCGTNQAHLHPQQVTWEGVSSALVGIFKVGFVLQKCLFVIEGVLLECVCRL